MVGAVVLDDKARLRVVEIRATKKPVAGVAEVDLNLRTRKASLQEQPAEASFHRGFRRLGELVMATQTQPQRLVSEDQVLYWR
jgi:hypothetical protein